MENLPTIETLDVANRTVLVRADLNVPLADGRIADDFRIRASLPTIIDLHQRGAAVVVCSHLGRPAGVDPALSLAPVADRMAELSGLEVVMAADVAGDGAAAAVDGAGPDQIVMLENTRFESGEKLNTPELADALAALVDVFVLDAFGSAHRAHASTVGVAERLPSAAGQLLAREVAVLGGLLDEPVSPFVVILGGAKVSDKLAVMTHLLPRVDRMLVGGGMCFTLLAALGYVVGDSLVEEPMVETVAAMLASPEGTKILLPTDVVVADAFAADAGVRTVAAEDIPGGWMGLDIGPATTAAFTEEIDAAGAVFWNGPMGVFEWEAFRAGTAGVASAVAAASGFTVVGGGDSVAALRLLGLDSQVDHLSSGGGAGLEMLEGKTLPGIAALRRWSDA